MDGKSRDQYSPNFTTNAWTHSFNIKIIHTHDILIYVINTAHLISNAYMLIIMVDIFMRCLHGRIRLYCVTVRMGPDVAVQGQPLVGIDLPEHWPASGMYPVYTYP